MWEVNAKFVLYKNSLFNEMKYVILGNVGKELMVTYSNRLFDCAEAEVND